MRWLWILLLPMSLAAAQLRIGSVLDGPSPRLEGEWDLIVYEMIDLLEPEFDVSFPPEAQFMADWEIERVEAELIDLLSNPDIDMVIAVGLLASHAAAQLGPLPKPVIATSMLDKSLPQRRIPNLAYVRVEGNLERDLAAFRQMVEFDHLAVLVDGELYEQLPVTEEELGPEGRIYFVGDDPLAAVGMLPNNTDAVYVTPLLRMDIPALAKQLEERSLPSFSLLGEDEVAEGMLLGLGPKSDIPRLARRVALNVQRIALGDLPSAIPTLLVKETRLSYNRATGDAIGYSPTWQVLTDAAIYGEPPAGSRFSFRGALDQALCINPEVLAARQRVRAGCGQVGIARSRLLPQVTVGGAARLIDANRARQSFGRDPERLIRGSAMVTQSIWSDRLWEGYDVQRHLQCGRKAEERQVQLDILLDVGVAYVELLRLKTLLEIEQQNLELTRHNLDLARARVHIGSARVNEVYRWDSQMATNQEVVVSAGAQVRIAEAQLNRLLHRPSLCPIATDEANLGDLMVVIAQRDFTPYISTPKHFQWFGEFQICKGWNCSPEIASVNAQIQAQNRRLTSAKRAFYSPDIEFFADGEERFVRGGAGVNPPPIPALDAAIGSTTSSTDYQVGVRATFPLYQGGGKCSRLVRDRALLRELCQERKLEYDLVSQRVATSLDLALASFLSIDLTYAATAAAERNLNFNVDAYAQGTASILDLLDAQDTQLTAQRDQANAQFDFGVDLLRVMRAVGSFDFFLTECGKQQWFDALNAYFAERK